MSAMAFVVRQAALHIISLLVCGGNLTNHRPIMERPHTQGYLQRKMLSKTRTD